MTDCNKDMDQGTVKGKHTIEMVIRTERCEDIEKVTYLLKEALGNIAQHLIHSPNARINGVCVPRALLEGGGLFAHQILIKFVELKKGVVVSEEYKECPEFKRLQASEANEEVTASKARLLEAREETKEANIVFSGLLNAERVAQKLTKDARGELRKADGHYANVKKGTRVLTDKCHEAHVAWQEYATSFLIKKACGNKTSKTTEKGGQPYTFCSYLNS